MKQKTNRILFLSVVLFGSMAMFSSCSKTTGVPSNVPKTDVPSPFAGNWSTNGVALIEYWDNGSYTGSWGNYIFAVALNADGTGYNYGYYEGPYGSTTFYRHSCGITYQDEGDGSATITMYPYSGETQYDNGPRKSISAGNLYPNTYLKLNHCTVYSENGKTYLQYYSSNEEGNVDTRPVTLERLSS